MAMYKCFNINDNVHVHRLYLPRKFGGHGLLAVDSVVNQEKLSLGQYLQASTEPLLQKVHSCNWFDCSETPTIFKSKPVSKNFQLWRTKPLHGQFL